MENNTLNRGIATFWWVLGVFLLIALVAIPFVNNNDNGDIALDTQQEETLEDIPEDIEQTLEGDTNIDEVLEQGIDPEQIVETPDAYLGQSVTVNAEVEDVVGPTAFTVEANDLIGQDLLVFAPASMVGQGGAAEADVLFEEESIVRIDGQVQQFYIVEVENQLGIDLDDEVYSVYEGRPYIVSDSVERIATE